MKFRNGKYDIASLGEVMMRLDPVDIPTAKATSFRIWHGGGETNVAEGASACFGLRTAIITALIDDSVGRNIESQIRASGVDTANIIWFRQDVDTDRKGTLHNGINFTWRGNGVMPSLTEYYRAHTAISKVKPSDFDFEMLFKSGVRWFHAGGIYAALSDNSYRTAMHSLQLAGKFKTFRSFDLNYRSKVAPNKKLVQSRNRKILKCVDFAVGSQDDFADALGYTVENGLSIGESYKSFAKVFKEIASDYKDIKLIGVQIRQAISADRINWGGMLYDAVNGKAYTAVIRENVEIYDRTGGGDSFVSGIAGALLKGKGLADAVEWGAAHGILAQCTPGDITMANEKDIIDEIHRAKTRVAPLARR